MTPVNQLQIRPSYRLADFCEQFGIGRSAAYAEIGAGRLRVFKVGKLVMVAGEDAIRWRDSYRNTPPRQAA
jgi:hypothetical protein